jgi:hypothetical protein
MRVLIVSLLLLTTGCSTVKHVSESLGLRETEEEKAERLEQEERISKLRYDESLIEASLGFRSHNGLTMDYLIKRQQLEKNIGGECVLNIPYGQVVKTGTTDRKHGNLELLFVGVDLGDRFEKFVILCADKNHKKVITSVQGLQGFDDLYVDYINERKQAKYQRQLDQLRRETDYAIGRANKAASDAQWATTISNINANRPAPQQQQKPYNRYGINQ